MDRRTGACIELSGTGAFLWRRLATPGTIDELVDHSTTADTADLETVRLAIERFVDELVQRGLLAAMDD